MTHIVAAYLEQQQRRVLLVMYVMIALAFAAGYAFPTLLMPWLRGDDAKPRPISECNAEVDRIAADLARVRRDCFREATR